MFYIYTNSFDDPSIATGYIVCYKLAYTGKSQGLEYIQVDMIAYTCINS